MKKLSVALILMLWACSFISFDAQALNLIANGDFESGNIGFNTDFTFKPGDIWDPATYDIVANPHDSHTKADSYFDHTSGDGFGLMMAVNGSETPDSIVWSQTMPVDPNQIYEFSLWYSSWYAEAPAGLGVQINGIRIADFNAPSTTGVWESFSVMLSSGASPSFRFINDLSSNCP